MSLAWYYAGSDGERHGPVSSQDLKQLATNGKLQPDDMVWKQGLDEWVPANRVTGLFPQTAHASPGTAPPLPPPHSSPAPPLITAEAVDAKPISSLAVNQRPSLPKAKSYNFRDPNLLIAAAVIGLVMVPGGIVLAFMGNNLKNNGAHEFQETKYRVSSKFLFSNDKDAYNKALNEATQGAEAKILIGLLMLLAGIVAILLGPIFVLAGLLTLFMRGQVPGGTPLGSSR